MNFSSLESKRHKRVVIEVANLSSHPNKLVRSGIQEVAYQTLLAGITARSSFPEFEIIFLPYIMERSSLAAVTSYLPISKDVLDAVECEIQKRHDVTSEEIWGFRWSGDLANLSATHIVDLIASAGYVQFQSIVNIGPILKAVHATGSYPFVGMTVHDFAPKLFPEFVPSEMPTWFEQEYLPSIEREADDVFCVSEQTARDAIQYLSQARPFKIWTLPLPIQIAAAAEPVEELLRVHGLVRDQFILFVGSFEPRKNFFALLDGYETYLRANPQSSMKLVVVGSSGWKNESELARLNSSPVATQIVRLGYLSDSHLVEITRAARAVAMLSHYEGYGLPLAQAVSLGTRCLTTLGSSLPEACAGLGYFVNPADPYSVAVGIKQIEQSKFRPTVPKLAEQRTWDNYVRSILEVIRVRLADRS